ncbi:MAG TPA: RdgB/HAM1 family non-canonical purine NTP pyrophosphatase [Arenimonas sp.]|uniref:RdgB/HAM1 family non-canonical purine NTP pyrophosphatase n=1 Tax=Arenimonas sp. TaxID=1872635 RepID=UPI002BDB3B66|nr:RdgB/HAM1 family non-canonical purine NTP pyrophosphatase [Arenimonas sp.]HMB57984.1 RdgB/HAM1 family non-canonical purine NTP pyrophosphatase [Arenimonas sp.]
MKKIVLATSNRGKLAEMQPLLADAGFELVTQGELGVPDAIEDGYTFIENALIKARHAAAMTGLPALADDSGLIVDALHGAPGLISAHYAGVHGDAVANIRKLLAELRGIPEAQRGARFISVIVLLWHPHDPQPLIAEGLWEGRVLETPRGDGGFGYDPVFFDPALGLTAAQLPAEVKNRVSHRGRALALLREKLAALAP